MYRLVLTLTLALTTVACAPHRARESAHAGALEPVLQRIESHYIEPMSRAQIEAKALTALLAKLDPYAQYFDAREWADFERSFEGGFFGIGVFLEPDETRKLPVVKRLMLGSRAKQAGVRRGDFLKAIDGRPLDGVAIDDVVEQLRGAAGTTLQSTFLRDGAPSPLEMTIERGRVPQPSVRGMRWTEAGEADYVLDAHDHLGYVRITSFGDDTVPLLRNALTRLDAMPARGLILDLRDSVGGKLSAAVGAADLFLDEGTIVTTLERGESSSATASPGVLFSAPVLMLINEGTASAAEVLAGALADHGRVRVMGQRSFGKGRIQTKYSLAPGLGGYKLSTGTFQRPSGKTIDRHDAKRPEDAGIAPDAGLEFPLDKAEHDAWLEAVSPIDYAVELTEAEQRIEDRVLDRAIKELRAMLSTPATANH